MTGNKYSAKIVQRPDAIKEWNNFTKHNSNLRDILVFEIQIHYSFRHYHDIHPAESFSHLYKNHSYYLTKQLLTYLFIFCSCLLLIHDEVHNAKILYLTISCKFKSLLILQYSKMLASKLCSRFRF